MKMKNKGAKKEKRDKIKYKNIIKTKSLKAKGEWKKGKKSERRIRKRKTSKQKS